VKGTKELQDALGRMHDLEILRELPRHRVARTEESAARRDVERKADPVLRRTRNALEVLCRIP
jgi:hypothetical protein